MSGERIAAAIVAGILLFAAVYGVRRAQRRIGSPVDVFPIFCGVWAVTLGAFAFPLVSYTRVPSSGWIVIYGALVATTLGCWVAWRFSKVGEQDPAAQVEALRATVNPRRLRLCWLLAAILGLVGFAAYLHAVNRVLGWQAVISDPGAVRIAKRSADFKDAYGPWKLFTYCNQIAFALWTIGWRIGAFPAKWRIAGVLGVLSLLPFFFTADRNLLAAAIVWTLALHLLWPRTGSWRRAGVALVVVLALGAGTLQAIGSRYGSTVDPQVAASVKYRALDPLVVPYLYLTANLPTFGQLMQDELAPRTYGQMSVLPFVKAAGAARVVRTVPVETGVFYPIPFETFSNYSWLGTFWLDFRAAGVLLLTAMMGGMATGARLRLVKRPSLIWLWFASLGLYIVAYSPLANVLSTSLTWQLLLVGPPLALILDPGAARRVADSLRSEPIRTLGFALVALGVVAGLAVFAQTRESGFRNRDYSHEVQMAATKAHAVFAERGHYPGSASLVSQLQVNRPEVRFRAEDQPKPTPSEAGVIEVSTAPYALLMQVKVPDGRVIRVRRQETVGGTPARARRRDAVPG